VIVIEPLKTRLQQLVAAGAANPLSVARGRFGSQTDYSLVVSQAQQVTEGQDVIIDLTPFDRIGQAMVLDGILGPLALGRRTTFLIRAGGANEAIVGTSLPGLACIALYDDSGKLLRVKSPVQSTERYAPVIDALTGYDALRPLHAKLSADILQALAAPTITHARDSDPADQVERDGRLYFPVGNRMLVTCYLNTKHLLAVPANLFAVAYEATRALYDSFSFAAVRASPYDLVITPSNTALLIASGVHALSSLPVAVVDSLGPLANRGVAALNTSLDVAGKRTCLIVDVLATGAEIDRTIQYLDYRRADIRRVIVCFDWGAGRPLLCDESKMTVLSRLNGGGEYVYRSK